MFPHSSNWFTINIKPWRNKNLKENKVKQIIQQAQNGVRYSRYTGNEQFITRMYFERALVLLDDCG